MKIFLSAIATASLTGGSVVSVSSSGNIETNLLDVTNTSASVADSEISVKNIQEIANITQLKDQQKIEQVKEEKIDNLVVENTSFKTHYSPEISANYVGDRVDSVTVTNKIILQQKWLQDLYKKQIDLSKDKTEYDALKTYVTTSTDFSDSIWEIAKESSGSGCKLQKKSNTATVTASTTYDECKTNWIVVTFDLNKMIKDLSEGDETLKNKITRITPTS